MLLLRVQGSLVAAVVGDCIGCLFECMGTVTMEEVLTAVQKVEQRQLGSCCHWGLYWLRASVHGRHHHNGKVLTALQKIEQSAKKGKVDDKDDMEEEILTFTDDTAMARSIAASLIENKDVNVGDLAERFAKEYKKEPARGYGQGVVTVLRALADPDLEDVFQPAREQFDGSGSYGNGGGMRIAPLGLFCHQLPLQDLKEKTLSVTRLTHTHQYAEVGALLQSLAVQLALSLDNSKPLDTNNFLDQLLERLRPLEKTSIRNTKKERRRIGR